jgi:hypothetical protein
MLQGIAKLNGTMLIVVITRHERPECVESQCRSLCFKQFKNASNFDDSPDQIIYIPLTPANANAISARNT